MSERRPSALHRQRHGRDRPVLRSRRQRAEVVTRGRRRRQPIARGMRRRLVALGRLARYRGVRRRCELVTCSRRAQRRHAGRGRDCFRRRASGRRERSLRQRERRRGRQPRGAELRLRRLVRRSAALLHGSATRTAQWGGRRARWRRRRRRRGSLQVGPRAPAGGPGNRACAQTGLRLDHPHARLGRLGVMAHACIRSLVRVSRHDLSPRAFARCKPGAAGFR